MATFHNPVKRDERASTSAAETVALSELEARPIRVAFAAVPSLLAIADAVSGQSNGVPRRWALAASSALGTRHLSALQPLVARPEGFVPDCLLGLSDATNADPRAAIRTISERASEVLIAELTAPGGPGLVGPWIEVAEEPRRWTTRYAVALLRTWRAVELELRGASVLIDREVERVGALAARGMLAPLLDDAYPDGSVCNGIWSLPATRPRRLTVAERGLTLIPKLTCRRSPVIRTYDGDALTHLAYPVPGASRELDPREASRAPLEALVGAQRSTLLHRLDRPQTVGGLADALIVVPGTATHHVDALEAAGLVMRERRGREVLVHRTARGTALLALYD